jgi:hypothetical protein
MLGQKLLPVAEVSGFLSIAKYPLISTAIMSGATARVAGSGHIMGASPPSDAGRGVCSALPSSLSDLGLRCTHDADTAVWCSTKFHDAAATITISPIVT